MTPYEAISRYYKGKAAKRSKLPYIRHINSGLKILEKSKYLCETLRNDYCSQIAAEAFCLHPFYQDNKSPAIDIKTYDATIRLAKSYSVIANGLLRHNFEDNKEYFRVEKYSLMWALLTADKIQNEYDFNMNRYLYDDYVSINNYFNKWFDFLKLTHVELSVLRSAL